MLDVFDKMAAVSMPVGLCTTCTIHRYATVSMLKPGEARQGGSGRCCVNRVGPGNRLSPSCNLNYLSLSLSLCLSLPYSPFFTPSAGLTTTSRTSSPVFRAVFRPHPVIVTSAISVYTLVTVQPCWRYTFVNRTSPPNWLSYGHFKQFLKSS